MDLCKISGNTHYIPGPTNTGVFVFKDKYSLLVDTGDGSQQAKRLMQILAVQGCQPKYIFNTHEHPDHCGGNSTIKDAHPGSIIYASDRARLFIENEFLSPLYLYGGSPPDTLSRHYRTKSSSINESPGTGTIKINDEKFDFLDLPGHAPGQMGIATRDRVCFIGDALFSPEIIAKYSFPFIFDVQSQIDTMNLIAGLEYDFFVLGHADHPYTHPELKEVLDGNRSNLDKYLNLTLELLDQPKTREDLIEELVILSDLELDLKEYFFMQSTLAAILTHLGRQAGVRHQLENGRLFYYKD